ncbi:MAG: hypothetical protein OEW39_05095 [Deltaproteobacteria bacterium]|nr:hypothetical protein [Deltaproteobacteria bacterium]
MIYCSGTKKERQGVQRRQFSVQLTPALKELFQLYELAGGPSPEMTARIDQALEASLSEGGGSREAQQTRLHLMLRVKDLNQYVQAEPGLESLKLKILEHVLLDREPRVRWAEIRELLRAALDHLCESPLPGLLGNLERYKDALSHRTSRLGRLLMLTALFNFDQSEEQPPHNLMLRFQRGRFPDHYWEVLTGSGQVGHRTTEDMWSPSDPLCRWEYLALDLAQSVMRGLSVGRPGLGVSALAPSEPGRVYCRLAPAAGGGDAQMDLLPFERESFPAELQRHLHRRHGPEAVRQLAVLMEYLSRCEPRPVLELNLDALGEKCALSDSTPRGRRTRQRKLTQVLEALSQVTLIRVTDGDGETARTAPLLALVGHSGQWRESAVGEIPAPESETVSRVRLVVDTLCWEEAALAAYFQNLPEALLTLPVSEHPFAVSLYLHLRQAWQQPASEGGLASPAGYSFTARALFQRAGIWISESGRYRALETLKATLEALRTVGLTGKWRVERAPVRDGMEDVYGVPPPEPLAAGLRPTVPIERAG